MGAHAFGIASADRAAHGRDDAAFTVATPRLIVRATGTADAGLNCVLQDRTTHRKLGWISFSMAPGEPGAIDILFFIEALERGRGLMREAIRAVARPAFARLEARVVRAELRADGAAAIAVVRGIGLRPAYKPSAAVLRFEKDLCGLL